MLQNSSRKFLRCCSLLLTQECLEQGSEVLFNSRINFLKKKLIAAAPLRKKPLRAALKKLNSSNQYKNFVYDQKYDEISNIRELLKSIFSIKNLTISFITKSLMCIVLNVNFWLKRSLRAANFNFEGRIWPAGRSLSTPRLEKCFLAFFRKLVGYTTVI